MKMDSLFLCMNSEGKCHFPKTVYALLCPAGDF